MSTTPFRRPPAVRELAQALRLTREFVGEELLPPIDGWSWYDALKRWAPEYLPTAVDPTSDESRRCPRCDCPDGHEQCEHCKVCPHAALPKVACAALHTDSEGQQIPCPGYPHATTHGPDRHPALTAKLHGAGLEDRLRDAEIRAAVAEHEAEAYRNQVQALVRELLRAREIPEEEFPQKVRVIILDEEAP